MRTLFEAVLPLIPFVLLVSVRVGVMLASLPAPFGSGAPPQIRVALGLFITIALCTPHFADPPIIPLEPVTLAVAGLGELMVGAVIGLTVRVMLAAAEVAGNVAGMSMGQGFAASIDPAFGEKMLPLGRLLSALMVLIFLSLNGHHVTFASLAWSLDALPVGNALGHAVHGDTVSIGADLMARGLRIASPILAAMFIVQLGMGLIARSAPRVQIFSLTFAITSAVGAVVLFAALPSVTGALVETLGRLPLDLQNALGGR